MATDRVRHGRVGADRPNHQRSLGHTMGFPVPLRRDGVATVLESCSPRTYHSRCHHSCNLILACTPSASIYLPSTVPPYRSTGCGPCHCRWVAKESFYTDEYETSVMVDTGRIVVLPNTSGSER